MPRSMSMRALLSTGTPLPGVARTLFGNIRFRSLAWGVLALFCITSLASPALAEGKSKKSAAGESVSLDDMMNKSAETPKKKKGKQRRR